MISRINTFLEKFSLQDRLYSKDKEMDLFACNYRYGYEVLDYEKQKEKAYLKDKLSLNQ